LELEVKNDQVESYRDISGPGEGKFQKMLKINWNQRNQQKAIRDYAILSELIYLVSFDLHLLFLLKVINVYISIRQVSYLHFIPIAPLQNNHAI
jgi:hypothetical protein